MFVLCRSRYGLTEYAMLGYIGNLGSRICMMKGCSRQLLIRAPVGGDRKTRSTHARGVCEIALTQIDEIS